MRTNNSKVKNTIISVYFILILLAIFLSFVSKSFRILSDNPTLSFLIIAFIFAAMFLLVHFISRYFEYDSDGLKVVVINRGLLLSDHLNYREKLLEFEKEKLVAYKFRNYFVYKTLTFYLRSSRGNKTKETFNITLVPKRKRKYIRQSLSKIVKANKKAS